MPTLSFDVFWRDHGAAKGLKDTGESADKTGRKFGVMQAGVAAGATAGAAALLEMGRRSMDVANDIAESTSKINVVFGKSAKSVLDFGETSAEKLGISKRAALEAAGTFGNLFVSLKLPQGEAAKMSTKMLTLAADMASFNNASPEEALEAIRSGLVGETEPLRRFGVNMNDATLRTQAMKMGLISNTKEALDPAVKAQAAYGLMLAQTGTAQGDFQRTADGAANQQRILKARFEDTQAMLGQKLLPALVKGGAALLTVADYIEKNSHWLVPLVAGLASLAAVVWTVNKAAGAYKATQAALNVVMALNPIGLVVIAIAALVTGLVLAYKKSDTFRNIVKTAFVAVARAGLDMAGTVVHAAASAFGWMPGIGPKLKSAAKEFDKFKARVNLSLNGIKDEGVQVNLRLKNDMPKTLYGVRVGGGQGSYRGGIAMATGGAVRGPGTGTSDEVPIWGSNGEHMWTKREVDAAGGHHAVEALRRSVLGDGAAFPRLAAGGPVENVINRAVYAANVERQLNRAIFRGASKLGAVASRAIEHTAEQALQGVLGGAALGGSGWKRQWSVLHAAFPGAALHSGYRPGAITASGNRSYHSMGRAIDVSPDMNIFNWLLSHYGKTSKEIIFSPAGRRQIKNGSPHYYTGAVRSMHFNHVHWAYDQGGDLQPGFSLAYNGTGKPERVLSSSQTQSFDNLVRVLSASGGSGSLSGGGGIDYARLGDEVSRAFIRSGVSVKMDGRAVGTVMGRATSLMERG